LPVELSKGFFFFYADLIAGEVVAELTYLLKFCDVLVIIRIVLVELLMVFIAVCVLLKLRMPPLFGVCMNLEFEDMNDISEPPD
jgi:hypothetical protein